jgi:hypothetical protein
VEEEWGAAGESSSARVNVRWTGIRFGNGFSQLDSEVEWTVSGFRSKQISRGSNQEGFDTVLKHDVTEIKLPL